jgi:hypothetical protein
LFFHRRGISKLIVVADKDHRQLHDRGKVHGFVNVAEAGGPLAKVHEDDVSMASLPQDQPHPAGHRQRGAQRRDDGDDAQLHISNVNRVVAAAIGRIGAPQPVGKYIGKRKAANHKNRKIAMAGKSHITRAHRQRRAHANGFLPTPHIDSAHNLALSVKHILNAPLRLARELQVIEHLAQGRGIQFAALFYALRRPS